MRNKIALKWNSPLQLFFFQETGGATSNDEYDCNAKDTNAEDFSNIEEALTDESSRSVKETFTYAIVP